MLISSLRTLRCAQQRLPIAAAGALASMWRGLAVGGEADGGGDSTAAASKPSSIPAADGGTGAAAAVQGTLVAIDRSALFTPQHHSHDPAVLAAAAAQKEPETELARHLKALIQFRGGPISLAEFMSEALTNPQHGYYSQRDVFGAAGDFVTSPEISQMMGEMVGIWCVSTWHQLGCPPRLHLVELGPGRGTLMADLLRGTAAFPEFSKALRVSMVEVSPHLRRMQWDALRCQGTPPDAAAASAAAVPDSSSSPGASGSGDTSSGGSLSAVSSTSSSGSLSADSSSSSSGSTSDVQRESGTAPPPAGQAVRGVSGWNGGVVSWHRSLEEVDVDAEEGEEGEGCPALYIAHEFLDALPVHQFQKTERGWCERLVDAASPDSPLHLRMVLSPGTTPAAHLLLPRRLQQLSGAQRRGLEGLEVCPQAMAVAESLGRRVAERGGAALVIDYGQDGPYTSSLQAIRRHQFVSLLEQPGTADLSNRVDYSALRSSVADSGAAAECLGPIPQALFLLGLGIEQRLEQLLATATPQQAAALRAGYQRLVGETSEGAALHEEGMGSSYQAFCIAQRGLKPWPFGAVVEEEEEEVAEVEAGKGEEAAKGEAGIGEEGGKGPGTAGEQQQQPVDRQPASNITPGS